MESNTDTTMRILLDKIMRDHAERWRDRNRCKRCHRSFAARMLSPCFDPRCPDD